MTDSDIHKHRAAIDAIDDKIIELLNGRCAHVSKVGALKKTSQKTGVSFVRSGREAEMVRRIYAAFKNGTFPAAAAAQMWRLIISASLSLESSLTISAYAPESTPELYWLAREYFGSFTPVAKEPTAKRVLGDVLDGKAGVGVLPVPDDTPDGGWWKTLPEGIKVFACAPLLLAKSTEIKALLVAKIEPEASGDDLTLLSIETDMDLSQSRLKAAFDKQKLATRWLVVEAFPSGRRTHLVEIKGFITAKDEAMLALKKEIGASLLTVREIGVYGAPIAL